MFDTETMAELCIKQGLIDQAIGVYQRMATASEDPAARRRYEERIRGLFQEGVELSELRADLDVSAAALLFLSAANWAYTWLQPGRDTDALADRFFALLVDGMRGYSTPA